jgi:hypothetical protein
MPNTNTNGLHQSKWLVESGSITNYVSMNGLAVAECQKNFQKCKPIEDVPLVGQQEML